MVAQEPGSVDSHPPVHPSGPWSSKNILATLLPLAVFVGASVLFLSTLSAHYSEGEDSINWVTLTTYGSGVHIFHANHIGFIWLNQIYYRLWVWLGYTGDASFPLKVLNALAGALTLSLMVRILRRVGADSLLILVWVGATAASFGFWSYATQAESYIVPMPAIFLGISVVIGLADDSFSPWSLALLGASMAFATMINQMHVLLVLSAAAAVVLVWYRRRSEVPVSRLLLGAASFGAAAALIIGVAYFGVSIFIVGLRDLDSIIDWSKGLAAKGLTTPFSMTDLIKGFIGMARAVLGGHFLCWFDWFYGPFTRRFPKLMVEERYLALGLSPGVAIVCLIATILAMLSGLIVLISLVFPGRHGKAEQRGEAENRRFFALNAFAWITLVASYVFNVVWEPTNDEFWIGLIPIAYLAIASVFARRPQAKRRRVAGAVFAASLFIANGLGAILPQTKLDSDYWYQANRFLIENARPGDVVVTDGGFLSDSYLGYYTKATVVAVHRIAPATLERVLSEEQPGRVWVSSWASEPSPQVRAAGFLPGRDEAAIRTALEKVRGQLKKRDENPWQTIWQLEPSSANEGSSFRELKR
jgi:hypothetical protein